jgi:hypothetical protein
MRKNICFQVFLFIFLISQVSGQNDTIKTNLSVPDTSLKSFRLFEEATPLEITLRFDLSAYFRSKPKKGYIKANITFHLNKSDSLTRNIRLRTRGEFRNQYCGFPPIELSFKNADFGYSDLNGISKLKLVPQCKTSSINENYVLREYLTYKLFQVFTDTSFRVRLLNINYIDTEKKRKPIRQSGFFIEPVETLTARTNSIQINTANLNQKSIIPTIMDRLAIFNYMIGNYDWAVPNQHNVKVIKPLVLTSTGRVIAIPYDFDWTGLVNADYAIPAENIGTQNVRERLFLGVCRSREDYQKDLVMFLDKKEEFYNVIKQFPYLSQRDKKDMTGYLDGFYNQLAGRKEILDILLSSCKKF